LVLAFAFMFLAPLGVTTVQAQDGSIEGWGTNGWGECDAPAPNVNFVAVAAGDRLSLGLKSDSSIVAWGYNGQGQCDVPLPNASFVAVAAGLYHGLGLKSDSTIVAWGRNWQEQCNVPAPNSGFVAVSGGIMYSLGLKSDGTIVAWGGGSYGELLVPAPNSGFVAIAAGVYHGLGLKSDSTIVAWGRNNRGQCNVPAPNAGFVAVSGGYMHSLGLKSDGTIVAWGDNEWGQCDVPSPNASFVGVSAGGHHGLGLKSDGSIVAWGHAVFGECTVPSPNASFVAVAGGWYHSLGLKAFYRCAGVVYRDDDGDCLQDPDEPGLAGRTLILDPGARAATTGSDGRYIFRLPTPGQYTVRTIPFPNWDVCPPTAMYTFDVVATTRTITGLDFGTALIPGVHDLSISLAGGPARRGFRKTYSVVYRNLGAEAEESQARFYLPEGVAYVDCSDSGWFDTISRSVSWAAPMLPGDVLAHAVRIEIPPNVPLGTQLAARAEVRPFEFDISPENNVTEDTETVTGSCDPNDKWVTPTTDLAPDGLLTYQINFQNVGTDSAFTVVVRDTLESNLDMATVSEEAVSHPYAFTKTDRELRWTFPNIGLPDSTVDQSGSNGFVKFTVRPVAGLPSETILTNRAAVVFDFNDPVMTNDVSTAFADLTGAEDPTGSNANGIRLEYGNPYRVHAPIFLAVPSGHAVTVTLYDVAGRLVSGLFEGRSLQERITFFWNGRDDSGREMPAGVYLLRVSTPAGETSGRVVLTR
jgi:uncharacterized repeat protein (TIGR01451 family)